VRSSYYDEERAALGSSSFETESGAESAGGNPEMGGELERREATTRLEDADSKPAAWRPRW